MRKGYRGLGYSSLISDPFYLGTWSQIELAKENYSTFETLNMVVHTKT